MTYTVITDDAFILSARPVGENDRLINFFTREHGKQLVRARSIRKESSRLRMSVIPYQYSRISFVAALHNTLKDIKIVTQMSKMQEYHFRQKAFVESLIFLSRFIPDNEPHLSVFSDLLETYKGIESAETEKDCINWKIAFISRTGEWLGYIPKRHHPISIYDMVQIIDGDLKAKGDVINSIEMLYSTSHL